ncbi:MAG: N-acetylmuramoyl-L-alanine amidase [Caulobacteraceae bacterium]
MTPIPAPSPNFNARLAPPDMIVLHYTGMASGAVALARLTDPAARVSAHYLIEEDGRMFALVPEARRAWHAGVSFWAGAKDINGASVGIELVNPGHEFGYRPFPEAQIAALVDLVADIRSRWTIPDERILGHSDVAPDRKTDPGELFPWDRLARAGHGLWAAPPPAPGAPLTLGAEGPGVLALQAALKSLGYDCRPTGRYDEATTTIVTAFQRHFVQNRFDGVADGATRARLIALLRLSRDAA